MLLDPALPDDRVRSRVFEKIPQPLLEHAVENVDALIRPPEDVFYKELDARYATVRRYLPAVLNHVRFEASPAGKPTASTHGGQETTLVTMMIPLLHLGMLIVGVPYSVEGMLHTEARGGTPYGATTIAGGQGELQPKPEDLAIARALGRRVAEITAKVRA